jgi:hypothetical protein
VLIGVRRTAGHDFATLLSQLLYSESVVSSGQQCRFRRASRINRSALRSSNETDSDAVLTTPNVACSRGYHSRTLAPLLRDAYIAIQVAEAV